MLGIVLISHADICTALLHGAEMICGEVGEKIATVSLLPDSNSSDFDKQVVDAIAQVDTGDGVVILADIAGGTPFNRAARFVHDTTRLIGGVNLAFLLELLSCREDEHIDYAQLIDMGHIGLREFTPVEQQDDELL